MRVVGFTSWGLFSFNRPLWASTPSFHDPNPPITLENPTFDEGDEGNWLVGAVARLSLAAVVVSFGANPARCLQNQQDDVVQFVAPSFVEEESWQNRVPPVPASLTWPQQWQYVYEERPLNTGFTLPPDEDFWSNPTAPVPASLTWPQQWPFDEQDPAGSLYNVPQDEGVGPLSPPPPLLPRVVPFSTDDEIVPQFAGTTRDEDFWVSGVAPTASALLWPQQWPGDEQTPGLRGQPDEDFWTNPVAPVPTSLVWPQPWVGDSQDPAGSLRGQPDEDFWVSGVAPVPGSLRWSQQWPFDIQDPGNLSGVPEEETGGLRITPDIPRPVSPFTADEEIVPQPAGAAPPDEDWWLSYVAPAPLTLAWPQQWVFDVQDPAGSLRGVPEEDAYLPYSGSLLTPSPIVPKTDTDEVPQPFTAVVDEEHWRSGVPPASAVFFWPQQWGFAESGEPTLYVAIRGITRNSAGTPLPGCDVHLFRTSDDVEIGQVVSNGVGYFEFAFGAPTAAMHYLVCYLAGAPDVAGTSVNTLVPS